MFSKFELLVGLRYLRAKQKNSFVSFISLVSIIGIALGVAALIIVLSVMNGFQREIREKIIGNTSHMQLLSVDNTLVNWEKIGSTAQHQSKHVIGYAPYIEGQGLVSFNGNFSGILMRGISAEYEPKVDGLNSKIIEGNFNAIESSGFNIIIGKELARQLGASIGDKITIITPDGQITPVGMTPRLKQFVVSGIFETHMKQYDSSLVYMGLTNAQILFKTGNAVTGVRLKVDDVLQTQNIKSQLYKVLPPDVVIRDWIDSYENYFAAVSMEKKMMFIVLTLIVAVATFNLVSTLVMSVNDKRSDIAILRTMGASERSILKIFILQGGISGTIGTTVGTILGVIIAFFIGDIVHAIEFITNSKLISGDIYLIDYLPSQINFEEVLMIFSTSIILSLLATIYPSRQAARMNPAEALRYE